MKIKIAKTRTCLRNPTTLVDKKVGGSKVGWNYPREKLARAWNSNLEKRQGYIDTILNFYMELRCYLIFYTS